MKWYENTKGKIYSYKSLTAILQGEKPSLTHQHLSLGNQCNASRWNAV